MSRLALLFVAVALAGCPKKSSTPATTTGTTDPVADPAPTGATCASAAANVGALIAKEFGGDVPPDAQAELAGVVETRCTSDGWSAEAIACIDGAQSGDDMDRCESTLTEAQADAIDADFERIMSGGGGGEEPPADEW